MGGPGQQPPVPLWERRTVFLVVGFVLLLTRVNVVQVGPVPKSSDVPVYADYMLERELGRQRGVPFYEAHARITRWRARNASRAGSPTVRPTYEVVEYPPLALVFLQLPTLGLPQLPPPLQPGDRPPRLAWAKTPEQEWMDEYADYFPYWMGFIDLLLFGLLFPFTRRLYPQATVGVRALALGSYLIATSALWPLLYTRLDLILAFLMVASLFLLVSRVHYVWSFAVLAVAINFKIIPVVLAPVWVIGALPAGLGPALFRGRVLRCAVVRAGALVALTVGLFLPFYFADGPATLDFLGYHKDRGLEVNSSYSYALMTTGWFGHPSELYHAHGSYNIRSPLSPFLVQIAPVVGGGTLLAATGLLMLCLLRLSGSGGSEPAPRETLAQTHPVLFVKFALLFLLLFIATNKVFSPQYILWLVPLACLLPWKNWPDRLSHVFFLGACGLTTLVFPFCFWDEVVGEIGAEGAPPTLRGPSPTGFLLVSARNLVFLALVASLLWSISRGVRHGGPAAGEPARH